MPSVRTARSAKLNALAMVGLCVGCSTPGSDIAKEPDPPSEVVTTEEPELSDAAVEALADGVITEEEYRAGFRRYQECVAGIGGSVKEGETRYSVIEYWTSIPPGKEDDMDACYQREFLSIDASWQDQHADTSESAHDLSECLRLHGIEPPEHYEDIVAAIDDAGIDVLYDCTPGQ